MSENKTEAFFEIDYDIAKEDFIQYAVEYGRQQFKNRKLRSVVLGIVQLVIAIGVFIWLRTSKTPSSIAYILCVVLFFLGGYTLVMHQFVVPRLLRSNADKQYEKSTYVKNHIQLSFFPKYLEEKAGSIHEKYNWQSIHSLMETDSSYVIHVTEQRTLLVPKSQLGEQTYELGEYFTMISEKFKKPLIKA